LPDLVFLNILKKHFLLPLLPKEERRPGNLLKSVLLPATHYSAYLEGAGAILRDLFYCLSSFHASMLPNEGGRRK